VNSFLQIEKLAKLLLIMRQKLIWLMLLCVALFLESDSVTAEIKVVGSLTQTLGNVIDELPPDGYRYQYFGPGLGMIGNAFDKVLSFLFWPFRV
jgi:hypothetical protein